MKKIAFLILILFTVIQAIPCIQSMWGTDQVIALDISEEKKTNKDDTKSNKEYLSFYSVNLDLTVKINNQIHLAESILPFPCFEKLTPPPDFC